MVSSTERRTFWVKSGGAYIFCFLEECNSSPRLNVLGSSNHQALERYVQRMGSGSFEFIEVPFGHSTFHLALRGYELLFGKDQKRSNGSDARYPAKRELGSRGFLIQQTPARAEASFHAHSKKTETVYQILGVPMLRVGLPAILGGTRLLRIGDCFTIPSFFWHQLLTRDHPALTIIEIVGLDALGMGDYIRE